MSSLYFAWLEAKRVEREATAKRRQIEDEIKRMANIQESTEGTLNLDNGNLVVRITTKLNRKINPDKLQEIAAENGLTAHLSALFRWKPEIDMKAWKSVDESITRPLMDAITTTPARASFKIEEKQ